MEGQDQYDPTGFYTDTATEQDRDMQKMVSITAYSGIHTRTYKRVYLCLHIFLSLSLSLSCRTWLSHF